MMPSPSPTIARPAMKTPAVGAMAFTAMPRGTMMLAVISSRRGPTRWVSTPESAAPMSMPRAVAAPAMPASAVVSPTAGILEHAGDRDAERGEVVALEDREGEREGEQGPLADRAGEGACGGHGAEAPIVRVGRGVSVVRVTEITRGRPRGRPRARHRGSSGSRRCRWSGRRPAARGRLAVPGRWRRGRRARSAGPPRRSPRAAPRPG